MAPIIYADPEGKEWTHIVDEAMWRTVVVAESSACHVETITVEPDDDQKAAAAYITAEMDDLSSSREKIALLSFSRMVYIGLPMALQHIAGARIKAAGKVIPSTRDAQEAWLSKMGIEYDKEDSLINHKYVYLHMHSTGLTCTAPASHAALR